MKKTLLSAIAGLVVIGSATALPTPDQAKENCERMIQNGTHIGWCARYAECVEKDPCFSKSAEQHKFCKKPSINESAVDFSLNSFTNDNTENTRIANAWIRAFMEFTHGITVKKDDFKFANKTMFEADNCIYQVPIAIAPAGATFVGTSDSYFRDALLAFDSTPEKLDFQITSSTTAGVQYIFNKTKSSYMCRDVRDTVNLLSKKGDFLQNDYSEQDGKCKLKRK